MRSRSKVRALVVVAAIVLAGARAGADPYASADAGLLYSSGAYRWASPALLGNRLVVLDATASGFGGELGGSVGFAQRWFSVGGEGSAALSAATSNGLRWSTITRAVHARLGGRIEARCKYPLYARASFGTQWSFLAGDSDDAGAFDNVWNPEPLRGAYGAIGIGVRATRWSLLARFDVAHLTSAHASYAPKSLFLGADFTWF